MLIDWNKNDEVTKFFKRIWENRQHKMYDYYKQWYINLAFFAGQQNLQWNDVRNQLEELRIPEWRQRFVSNLIQPIVLTRIAKLLKNRPWLDVLPATGDLEDGTIAFKNKRILQFYWEYLKLDLKHLDALLWQTICGNIFYKVVWDPREGDWLEVSPSDLLASEDMTSEDRKAVIKLFKDYFDLDERVSLSKTYNLPIGDPSVLIVPPFGITVPGRITDIDKTPWLMESKTVEINALHDRYGKRVNHIQSGDVNESDHQVRFERKIESLNKFTINRQQPDDDIKDHVYVHELWVKPSRKRPNGGHFIIAGGKIINEHTEIPYKHRRIPYIHSKDIPVPGKFWGTSIVEQLIEVQKDYNKTKSQLNENRDTMSKGKWLVPNGSGIREGQITSEPFQQIPFNWPFKPEQVVGKPIPSYVERILGQHRQDMDDISGQHEVSRAQVPGQVRSGAAIGALQEADDGRLNTNSLIIDESLSQVGSLLLDVVAQFVREERLGQILGDVNGYETFFFTGSEMQGKHKGQPNVSYTRVRVKTFSQLPMSRAAQQEMIDRLIKSGILNPERDREKILTMLNLGSTEEQIKPGRNARAKALYENELMMQGQPAEARMWEMHEVHIQVHTEFMNSAVFDQLDEDGQKLVYQHLQLHMELQAAATVYPQVLLAKHTELAQRQAAMTMPALPGAMNETQEIIPA